MPSLLLIEHPAVGNTRFCRVLPACMAVLHMVGSNKTWQRLAHRCCTTWRGALAHLIMAPPTAGRHHERRGAECAGIHSYCGARGAGQRRGAIPNLFNIHAAAM